MSNLKKEFPDIEEKYLDEIEEHASDILNNEHFLKNKTFIQHGNVTVYEHVVRVTARCLEYADKSKHKLDRRTLVRAGLLHDYFLYDWHNYDNGEHRLHGLHHPKKAANNAKRDYKVDDKVYNAIRAHMWPLGSDYPRTREAWIVLLADKDCAFEETFSKERFKKHKKMVSN